MTPDHNTNWLHVGEIFNSHSSQVWHLYCGLDNQVYFSDCLTIPLLYSCLTNIFEIMICVMKVGPCHYVDTWYIKWKLCQKYFNDHQSVLEGSVQSVSTQVFSVVHTLWVKLLFFWITPVVTPLLYPTPTHLEPPSSFSFVCFFVISSCCICLMPLFSYFLFSLSALSHNTSLSAQNSTHLFLPLSYFMFYLSIYPSPHHHSLDFSPSH